MQSKSIKNLPQILHIQLTSVKSAGEYISGILNFLQILFKKLFLRIKSNILKIQFF